MIDFEDIRNSPEYAAAWDLELWKAVQLQKIQHELRSYECKGVDDAHSRILKYERDTMHQIEMKLKEVIIKEQKLASQQDQISKRRSKLIELETVLKRQIEETDDFRKRIEDEANTRVKRVKEEVMHKMELLHQRLLESQDQAKRSEERTTSSQREYLKLWEDFSEFKTKTLSLAAPQFRQQLNDALSHQESQKLLVQERHDRRIQELEQHHQERYEQLHRDHQKISEQYVHRREQCRSLQHALAAVEAERNELSTEIGRLRQQLGSCSERHTKPQSIPVIRNVNAEVMSSIQSEVSRLQKERANLLTNFGGTYHSGSAIILDLDNKIRKLQREACSETT